MKYLPLSLAWVSYFLLHSLFASLKFKNWLLKQLPSATNYYRLAYNIVAITLLFPPLYLSYAIPEAPLWAWNGYYGQFADLLAISALAGFLYSLRGYDGMDFLGIRQLQTTDKQTPNKVLCISFFHRFVRHPWYFFALIIIWTRDMNTSALITSILITTYFVIGSRLEEKKLVVEFGNRYEKYKKKVPGLIPVPWRLLSLKEVKQLTEEI